MCGGRRDEVGGWREKCLITQLKEDLTQTYEDEPRAEEREQLQLSPWGPTRRRRGRKKEKKLKLLSSMTIKNMC